ncbi:hypothetical protein [Aquimarina algiphila]|uniref:hypothetical protein n=1 Tax=Aquimarina algiphila TaxID=2047982 RepID=UPI002490BAE7|nr:hypothetical protein [Aquimarina algiphila]
MLRTLFLGLVLIFTLSSNAQKNINDYKYIIVPESYGFLKGNDTYQLNSLTKFLFNKYGFKAFLQSDNLPDELRRNGCSSLRADVKKRNGVFVTRLTIELTDCSGKVVFSSSEGSTREKDFKKAYQLALRDAFKDVEALNYTYSGYKEEIVAQNENAPTKEEVVKKEEPREEEVIASAPVSKEEITYLFNDTGFVFKKQEYGFELFQKDEKVAIGKLFKSTNGKTYIVKAGDLSGNGYFDAYGNFILERINPVTNKLITDTFARQ